MLRHLAVLNMDCLHLQPLTQHIFSRPRDLLSQQENRFAFQETWIFLEIASSEGRVFGLVGLLLLLVERVTAKLAAVDKFLVGITRFVFHFVLPVHLVRVRPRPKMFPSGRSGRVGVTQRGSGWVGGVGAGGTAVSGRLLGTGGGSDGGLLLLPLHLPPVTPGLLSITTSSTIYTTTSQYLRLISNFSSAIILDLSLER